MTVPSSFAAIFAFVFVGGFIAPLPHDAILALAGYSASVTSTPAALAVLAGLLATIAADTLLYGISRAGGPLFRRLNGLVPSAARDRLRARFQKRAGLTIFLTRFIIGLRLAVPLIAGSSKYPFWKFQLYNGAAVVIYAPLFVLLGYVFHNNLSKVLGRVGLIEHVLLIGLLIGLVLAASFGIGRAIRRRYGRGRNALPPAP